MADSPLKFLKFRIGQIKINIDYANVRVQVQLSDLQVRLESFTTCYRLICSLVIYSLMAEENHNRKPLQTITPVMIAKKNM
jgi:hypothetical protein